MASILNWATRYGLFNLRSNVVGPITEYHVSFRQKAEGKLLCSNDVNETRPRERYRAF